MIAQISSAVDNTELLIKQTIPKYPSFCLHKVHITSFCFAQGKLNVTITVASLGTK